MTDSFKLTINRDAASPVITVECLSNPGQPPTRLALAAGAKLPYPLAIDQVQGSPQQLLVRLDRPDDPFDPEVTRDSNVLHVATSLSDHRFETQDDTRYILHITNQSRYYIAEDIHVSVRLDLSEQSKLSDEAAALIDEDFATLSLTPGEQHIPCIDPGQTRDLVFVAVSRGPKPGLYHVDVTVAYRIVYWDGRGARDSSRHLLPVHGPDSHFDLPRTSQPALMPRQPSLARSNTMSDERPQQKVFFASPPAKPNHRHLKPIEQRFPLPGGGWLVVSYRLLKGMNRDADGTSSTYGCHPDTGEVESYFSTQDTAVLELTLSNESIHSLKHLRLSNIHIMSVETEKSPAKVVKDTLPDGNLLFEVVPSEAYFGHLAAQAKAVRYLSLITRGIHWGNYTIHVQVNYDIEQCQFPVDLGVTVRPD
jgi:hypothetical protein